MGASRSDFGSADDIEAGRIAVDKKRVIRAGGGYGTIKLVVRDNIVLESFVEIAEHHREKKKQNG
jgi:hypothetical protein